MSEQHKAKAAQILAHYLFNFPADANVGRDHHRGVEEIVHHIVEAAKGEIREEMAKPRVTGEPFDRCESCGLYWPIDTVVSGETCRCVACSSPVEGAFENPFPGVETPEEVQV